MLLSDIMRKMATTGEIAADVSWLDQAEQRPLSHEDLVRINGYVGTAGDLHQLLDALLPLPRPVWYEATVTAQGGTETVQGYGAIPHAEGVEIVFACYLPAKAILIGPVGPARLTPHGIERPDGLGDEAWHELRVAAGIVVRALLLDAGK